ncbi:MAG TPA: NAD(P)-dependent alcohol dehydrogenase [Polyangiales bacterium]|nr:NAD(P)-dependent alcohol dehydrogenase [Polyangiales bacterium]
MQSASTSISAPAAGSVERDLPMRAILQSGYGSSDVLRLGSTARPAPRAGEVLVKVAAAGIDRGTWHLMTGRPYLMRVMGFGFWRPNNPVAGLDLAGTVVEVGPQVTRFAVGDLVFGIGQGTFAEYARAREDKLTRVPQGLGLEQAAVLAVSGSTALQALDAAELKAGERVLVIGASGGVGSYAVQIAKALGAEVTGVCSASKLEFVRSLGAAHVIDYRSQDFAGGVRRYDVVLDMGGNTPIARLRRCLIETGRVVFIGNEQGGDWTAGFGRQIYASLLGRFVKQRFTSLIAREHFSSFERLAELCAAGQIRPAIDRCITLSEVPEALRALEAGAVKGKIAVVMG